MFTYQSFVEYLMWSWDKCVIDRHLLCRFSQLLCC